MLLGEVAIERNEDCLVYCWNRSCSSWISWVLWVVLPSMTICSLSLCTITDNLMLRWLSCSCFGLRTVSYGKGTLSSGRGSLASRASTKEVCTAVSEVALTSC
jgi:hypothetical protein